MSASLVTFSAHAVSVQAHNRSVKASNVASAHFASSQTGGDAAVLGCDEPDAFETVAVDVLPPQEATSTNSRLRIRGPYLGGSAGSALPRPESAGGVVSR